MKPALIAGRGGEGKNKKTESQNIQRYKIETQTLNISILLQGRKNAWLDNVLFFLKQAGERKNLPTYNGKSRIPSVRLDRIHRLSVYRVPELYRVLHSMTRTCCWYCNHTRPSAERGRRRCWKKSTDIQTEKCVVFVLVSVCRLSSIYACLSTNTTRVKTNRSVEERKLTYFWSLWAYGTSDFCHCYDCDQIRSATQQQGQIEEGAERRAELSSCPPRPTTRSPRTDTTRDSGAILKCQLFFLQVSFPMPTRLYLSVFFGLQVSFEMPTFFTWLVPLFFTMVKILHFVKIEPGG
jgi:hypothetical protein